MSENKSIKYALRNKIFIYSLIPAALILTVICFVVVELQWNRYVAKVEAGCSGNAQYINMQLTYLDHTLNNIIYDGVIENAIFRDEEADFSEKIMLLNEIDTYCKRFYNSYNADNVKIRIYHNREGMFRSDYLRDVRELDAEVCRDILETENHVRKWIVNDDETTIACNMSKGNKILIFSCKIDRSELNGFLSTDIYYSGTDLLRSNLSISAEPENIKNSRFVRFEPLVSGQYLVAEIPRTKMFEICGMVFGIGLGTLALVFVFSMIMADMTSVKLTRKLYDFLDLMKNEKLYKNIESIRIDSEDELYIIFEKIKQLLADIENINAEKRALIKENTDLQLAHAQSQINPHLLYNALSVIRWSCVDKAPEIVDQIDAMVDYYRMSISDISADYTIKDEIRLVESYLKLISIIHEIDYKYVIDIEPEMMQIKTIQHVFQPIVENSVLYGINGNPNGCITITGRTENGKAIFEICDNGVGFDSDSEKTDVGKRSGSHIGLKNTNLRIKLNYGADSGIMVKSSPGNGCKVIIVMRIDENT